MERLVPPALQPGDTIAFVSPGIRLNEVFPERIANSQKWLEYQGYHVKIIYHKPKGQGFLDSVSVRCDEIHEAFGDPRIKAIICTAGGDSANEIVTHLNYDLIRQNPKIFCGFSGIAILHCAILAQTGLQTFYGPTALTELSEYPRPLAFTADHFLHVLRYCTKSPIGQIPRSPSWIQALPNFEDPTAQSKMISPSPRWTWLRAGKATGRLVGGCLRSLVHVAVTPAYWPDMKDRILFVETGTGDRLEDPFPVDESRACLVDLLNMGVFRDINGLVFGRPYAHDEELRKQLAQVIEEVCVGDFPVLMNPDFGHTAPNLTLPIGALASLDSDKDEFAILESAVVASEGR